MRRVLLFLPLLALAGCKEESSPPGAVKVTVTYQGFKPGCVRVLARDVEGGHELHTDVESAKIKGGPTGGSIVVGVLPPDTWGSTVKVEALAFERDCTGDTVVSNSQQVTMTRGQATPAALSLQATDKDADGYVSTLTGGTDCDDDKAAVNPGVADELCNGVDDNCNSQTDQEELRLEQACTEGDNCQGTRRCGDDGKVVCNVPNATLAYPDVDRDGHGDKTATATAFCNGVPAGYVTGPNDDCDDSAANGATVFPGALERCDDRDNDCDGLNNETFPLNQSCTDSTTQCGGTQQCNPAGTAVTCVVTEPVPTWYPDDDGDGHGRNAGSQQTCVQPAGAFVDKGEDCDDGNPFTYRDADELCDGLDNDCDTLIEASSVCPAGGPIWAEQTVGSPSPEWRSVFTETSGGVGVVGFADARALLSPGSNTFQTTVAGCGTNTGWNTLWVDEANNGRAYFGSEGGRLVYQDRTNAQCSEMRDIDRDVRGLVGIRNGTSLEIHGVTNDSGTSGEGSTFIWDGAGTLTYGTTAVGRLRDIHGISRDALFAVGMFDPIGLPAESRIYRFNASGGQWKKETLPLSSGTGLNGVWVVNEKVAFAVGEASTVLKWDGKDWTRMTVPDSGQRLTSVVAFGANLAYASAFSGNIYRYDGKQWTRVFQDTSLRLMDIAGTSPENLWVVGHNGVILHWPQWPQ